MRIYRDADGDVWIEIPGAPGCFVQHHEFGRGQKYVERWWETYGEIARLHGPLTLEFSDEMSVKLEPK